MWRTAKTYWVWTESGIVPHPEEREVDEPIYETYRKSCPRSWVEKGYVREATTQEVNSRLTITNVKGKKFDADQFKNGQYMISEGFAFYAPGIGYLAFNDSPFTPYIPCGGRKALEEILTAGGMTDYDTITFILENVS